MISSQLRVCCAIAAAVLVLSVCVGVTRAADPPCNPAWVSTELSVARAGLTGVAFDDVAVFVGGGSGPGRQAFDVIDMYNATSRRWTAANLGIARDQVATALVRSAGVVIFAGGRLADGRISKTIEAYNPLTGAWASANLTVARYGASAEVVLTTPPRIVIVGGWDGTGPTNATDVFTFSGGKFTTVTQSYVLKARHAFAASTTWTSGSVSRAFFAGGIASGATTNTDQIDVFNGTVFINNTLSIMRLAVARHALTGVTVGNAVIFAGGKIGLFEYSADIDILLVTAALDKTTVVRTLKLSVPRARPAAAVFQNVAYFAGGLSNSHSDMSSVIDIVDPVSLSVTSATLSVARAMFVGVTVRNQAIFAGGWTGSGVSSRVDIRICAEVDCVVSAWSSPSLCTATCGGGNQTRTRTVTTTPTAGGAQCPSLIEVTPCNSQACVAADCLVSEWSAWSACNIAAPCGGNSTIVRTRSVTRAPSNGGSACPTLNETQLCYGKPCAVNCVVAAFGEWSNCSAQCDGGSSSRVRSILTAPSNNGTACPTLVETVECNKKPCPPVNCVTSDWSTWSECYDLDAPLCNGTGRRTRTRTVLVAPIRGGAECGGLQEDEVCYSPPCPVDCVVGEFSAWGACSVSCGGGWHESKRVVLTQPAFGGRECPSLSRGEPCNMAPCNNATVDCVVTNWGDSVCRPLAQGPTCGGLGVTTRTRTVVSNATGDGLACPALTSDVDCALPSCPIDCVYGNWTEWTPCSSECGGGSTSRRRLIDVEANFGGKPCDQTTFEEKTCNENACRPVNCTVSDWGVWSTCEIITAAKCGVASNGTQSRSRSIVTQNKYGGAPCPPLVDYKSCSGPACDDTGTKSEDCVVGNWTAWTPCPACQLGATLPLTTRTRPIITARQGNGIDCPELQQSRECTEIRPCSAAPSATPKPTNGAESGKPEPRPSESSKPESGKPEPRPSE
eukprot:Opistho-2@11109